MTSTVLSGIVYRFLLLELRYIVLLACITRDDWRVCMGNKKRLSKKTNRLFFVYTLFSFRWFALLVSMLSSLSISLFALKWLVLEGWMTVLALATSKSWARYSKGFLPPNGISTVPLAKVCEKENLYNIWVGICGRVCVLVWNRAKQRQIMTKSSGEGTRNKWRKLMRTVKRRQTEILLTVH